MDAAAALGAGFAVAGGWIGPGLAAATALRLGCDGLERAVLGIAIGRVLLALVALAATATGAPRALVAWGALGLAAGAFAVHRSRRDASLAPTGRGVGAALGVALGVALALAHAVVLRSALDRGGALVFYGRDAATDPFVYGAYALALLEGGPPLANPFAGGDAVPGSYALFAVLAGLAAIGNAPMPDLVYRAWPLAECVALAATAVAFARALAAPRAAWALAPLALLGGEPAPLVTTIARTLGLSVHAIDSFALFGPYLIPVNPISAGLQTLFAALCLLARPRGAREAIVAGALLGALFEIKLFLWAPVVAGLGAAAFVRPPPALRRPLRIAAASALVASLPSLIDKARFVIAAPAHDDTGFAVCLACLPRYLARAAWGDGELSFAVFRAGSDLSPRGIAFGALATLAVTAVALGARAFALPELARGARDAERAAPYRVLAFAAAIGLALAMTVAAPPHYLNAAQFAWVAVFGWAPVLALACARWLDAGRWLPIAATVLLAAPGAADAIVRLGYGAPQRFAISAQERALAAAVAHFAAPGEVVFEPSMLIDTDRPSALPLFAARPVYLSLLSAVSNLPADERDARFARLAAYFVGDDAAAARRALAESGASFVLVPAGAPPLPAPPADLLFENAAGRLYRAPASASVAP